MTNLNLKSALATFTAVFDGVCGATVAAGLHVDIELAYAKAVEAVDQATHHEWDLSVEDALDLASLRSLIATYRGLPIDRLLAFLSAKTEAAARVCPDTAEMTERRAAEARVRAALIAVDGIPTESLAKSNLSVLIQHLAHEMPTGTPGSLISYLRKEADSLQAVDTTPMLGKLFESLHLELHPKHFPLRYIDAAVSAQHHDDAVRHQSDHAACVTA